MYLKNSSLIYGRILLVKAPLLKNTEYKLRIQTISLSYFNLAGIKSIHIQSYYNSLLKNNNSISIKATHNLLSRF